MLTDVGLVESDSYDETEVLTVKSFVSSLLKSLDCPICLDLLDDPVCTTCHHIFCRKCIKTFLQRKFKVPCPLCVTPISKRSLREKPKFQEILCAVREIAQGVKDDCGLDVSPPKPFLVSNSPEARSSMLAFQLAHPSPDKHFQHTKHSNPGTSSSIAILPHRKTRRTPSIHVDEDAENMGRNSIRNSTNTNIYSGFPVARKLRKLSADKTPIHTIESYFVQSSSTCTAGSSKGHPKVSNTGVLQSSSIRIPVDLDSPEKKINLSTFLGVNESKKIIGFNNTLNLVKINENNVKSVDDVLHVEEEKTKNNMCSDYDDLEAIVNCRQKQAVCDEIRENESLQNVSTKRIFKSKNNENSEPVQNVSSVMKGETVDPYHFIASQRTPKKGKKKRKKSKVTAVRNSLKSVPRFEKSFMTDIPLKEIKSNLNYKKEILQQDSLDDFQDNCRDGQFNNMNKTTVNNDTDDLFFFMTPAENVQAYCSAFGGNIEEFQGSPKSDKNLKRRKTPRSCSAKKKKAVPVEKDEYLLNLVEEIAKSEAHELTIVGQKENLKSNGNNVDNRKNSFIKPKNVLSKSEDDANNDKEDEVLVKKRTLCQSADDSDSSDTEPLPYLHREDLRPSDKMLSDCPQNNLPKTFLTFNESSSHEISSLSKELNVCVPNKDYSELQHDNADNKEAATTNFNVKENTRTNETDSFIATRNDNRSTDIAVLSRVTCVHSEDEDLEPTQLLSTQELNKAFSKQSSNNSQSIQYHEFQVKDCEHALSSSKTSAIVSDNHVKKLESNVDVIENKINADLLQECNSLTKCFRKETPECSTNEEICLSKVKTSQTVLQFSRETRKDYENQSSVDLQCRHEDICLNLDDTKKSLDHSDFHLKGDMLSNNMCTLKETNFSLLSQVELKNSQEAKSTEFEVTQEDDILDQVTQPFSVHTQYSSPVKNVTANNPYDDKCVDSKTVDNVKEESVKCEQRLSVKDELPMLCSKGEDLENVISVSLTDQHSVNPNVTLVFKVSLNNLKANVMGSLCNLSCPGCHNNINVSVSNVQVKLSSPGENSTGVGEVLLNIPKTNDTFLRTNEIEICNAKATSGNKKPLSQSSQKKVLKETSDCVRKLQLPLVSSSEQEIVLLSSSSSSENKKESAISFGCDKENRDTLHQLEDKVTFSTVEADWGSFPSNMSSCNSGLHIKMNNDIANISGAFDSDFFDSAPSEFKCDKVKAQSDTTKRARESMLKENMSLSHSGIGGKSENNFENNPKTVVINEICDINYDGLSCISDSDILDSQLNNPKTCKRNVFRKTISENITSTEVIAEELNLLNRKLKDVSVEQTSLVENGNNFHEVNEETEFKCNEEGTDILVNKSRAENHINNYNGNQDLLHPDSLLDSPNKRSSSSLEDNIWSSKENDRYSYCDENINAKHYDEDIFASISSTSSFDENDSTMKRINPDVTVLAAPKKLEPSLDFQEINFHGYNSPEYDHLDADMSRFLKDSDGFSDIGENDIAINFQRIAEKQKLMMTSQSPAISVLKSSTSETSIKPLGIVKKTFPTSSSGSDNQSTVPNIACDALKYSQKALEKKQKAFRRIRTFSDSSSEPENFSPMLDTVITKKGKPIKEYVELSSEDETANLRPSQAMAKVFKNIQADLHCADDRSQENASQIEELVFGKSPLGFTEDQAQVNFTDLDLQSAFSTETGDLTIEAKSKLVAEIEDLKLQLEEWKQKQRFNAENTLDEMEVDDDDDAIPPTPERPGPSFKNTSKISILPFQ